MKRSVSLRLFFLLCCMQGSLFADDFDHHGSAPQDRLSLIQNCIEFAITLVQKGYQFFGNQGEDYDLQQDVLEHPSKQKMYATMCKIEQLFDDANKHDQVILQIKAILLLCRMAVPGWYYKSYQKGLKQLLASCFDEQGNFVKIGFTGDIRIIFKEYCKKAPENWQDIARISDWWCKHKKSHFLQTDYYALTCTQYNAWLLQIVQSESIEDLQMITEQIQNCDASLLQVIFEEQYKQLSKQKAERGDHNGDHELC